MVEQIKMLFAVNTPGGSKNIVLDGSPYISTERGRGGGNNFRDTLVYQERLKLET